MKQGIASIEYLYHYKCPDCDVCISIGDAHLMSKKSFACPHCRKELQEQMYQILVHLSCPHCNAWWTMGDMYYQKRHILACPYCKEEADFSQLTAKTEIPDTEEEDKELSQKPYDTNKLAPLGITLSDKSCDPISIQQQEPYYGNKQFVPIGPNAPEGGLPDDSGWGQTSEQQRQEISRSFAGKIIDDADRSTEGIKSAYRSMERFNLQEIVAQMILDNARLLLTGGVQVLAKQIVEALVEALDELATKSEPLDNQQQEVLDIIQKMVNQINLWHQCKPVTDRTMLEYMGNLCKVLDVDLDVPGLYLLILKRYTQQTKLPFEKIKTNTTYDSILYNWMLFFAVQLPDPAKDLLIEACNNLVHSAD